MDLRSKMEQISVMLNVAGQYGGAVFGGYLRDVLIPRLSEPTWTAEWANVNLWFTSCGFAEQFVAQMGSNLRHVAGGSGHYSGNLYHGERRVTAVFIVASATLPVNDFDVNQAAVFYQNGRMHTVPGLPDHEFLGWKIERKRATMLPSYARLLLTMEDKYALRRHFERLIKRYMERGWTIYTPDGFRLNHFEGGELIIAGKGSVHRKVKDFIPKLMKVLRMLPPGAPLSIKSSPPQSDLEFKPVSSDTKTKPELESKSASSDPEIKPPLEPALASLNPKSEPESEPASSDPILDDLSRQIDGVIATQCQLLLETMSMPAGPESRERILKFSFQMGRVVGSSTYVASLLRTLGSTH
jgi:hypothetical protein